MEETVAIASPATGMLPETGVNTQIIEEVPRVCPLCSSEVKLFFINFHEKLLMCENTECEFPFGYEELQFVRVENGHDVSDVFSERTRIRPFSPCISETTTSAGWAETDKLNRACQPEDILNPKILNTPTKFFYKNKKELYSRKKEKQMQLNVEDLKGLTLELSDMTKTRVTIKNKKWINNLRQLQDQSGLKLLGPQENEKLPKKEKPKSEMKIDIEPGSSGGISSIKIEIANQAASQSQADLDSLRKMDELNIQ